MSHSPTPWKTKSANLSLGVPQPVILSASERMVASLPPHSEFAEADTERIVLCVNACRHFDNSDLEPDFFEFVFRKAELMDILISSIGETEALGIIPDWAVPIQSAYNKIMNLPCAQ